MRQPHYLATTHLMTRRAFLAGLTTGAISALLAACGGARPSTMSPTPLPVTPTAPLTTRIAPPLPSATPLSTRFPTATATRVTAAMVVWSDPGKTIEVRYPRGWFSSLVPAPDRENNLLALSAPVIADDTRGQPVFWLDRYDPQRGTPDDEVQHARDGWAANTQFRVRDEEVREISVGGEPATSLVFTYTPTYNPTIHNRGQDVFVNHSGTTLSIEAVRNWEGTLDTGAEIDAIIGSIRFLI